MLKRGKGIRALLHVSNQAETQERGVATNMGNFVSFDTEIVDDDVPTDGKGLGKGKRLVMKYENGHYCWNEPREG
jgi:protein kinase C substrate 80K-H